MAYATTDDERMPHMVLMHPDTDTADTVNVRIHSECMTGDVFHSYRCECGEQLDWSMDYIQKHTGVIIYLRQEGRGIGIINKLHAYVNDDRTYEDAISILEDLGIQKISLMTNNPDKIDAFESTSVDVITRIPVELEPKIENEKYLQTKKNFFGHKLGKISTK